jgi:putative membrane protein
MVKILSTADQRAIQTAIKNAGRQTSAQIRLITVPASDRYTDFILLYGLLVGSLASFALWYTGKIIQFPLLLIIQLGVITLIDVLPWLHRLCIRLVSRHERHRRAGIAALREYHALTSSLQPDEAFVLLYVSLAERYVHIVTNPTVHKKLPDNWDAVTGHFIETIREKNLRTACVNAIGHIADILAPHFPV